MLVTPLLTALLLEPGAALPPLGGEYLSGRKANLPADARGKTALLVFGFTYQSRFAVEKLAERFREEFTSQPEVTFYEIPMIGGMARMGKFFIDRGMRSGTPKPLHENVITVWGGVDPWKKRFGVTRATEDHAWVAVLDRDGKVAWSGHGLYTRELFDAVRAGITTARAAAPKP